MLKIEKSTIGVVSRPRDSNHIFACFSSVRLALQFRDPGSLPKGRRGSIQIASDEQMLSEQPVPDFVASEQLASAVENSGTRFPVSASGVLFRQDDEPDGVYYLKTGEATLSMQFRGKSVMSLRVTAGSLLGLPAVVGNNPYSLSAIASEGAVVYKISSSEFKQMIARNSRLCADVLRILACEVHSARTALAKVLRETGQ